MGEVFVVGALHLDVVVDAPHLPALDETVVGSAVAYRFGGKGGNQAAAAARMGARVAMAGRVGRDAFGERLLAELDAAGVCRSQVLQGTGASGMSVAIVDQRGDYGAVIVSGVNREIRPEDVTVPNCAKVVLLQNEIPEAVNLAVATRVPADVLVILNAAPVRPVAPELIESADILVVNRVEAEAMTAAVAASPAGPARKTLIVTRGAKGLTLAEAGRPPVTVPAHAVPVASTHGAGDTFLGALAAELSRGAPLDASIRFAQAAAALAVSTAPDDRAAVGEAAVRAFLNQVGSP